MDNQSESAMVNVALGLSRSTLKTVGEVPSEEELAAYYDGGLDPTRRAQVYSHIVGNPDVYSQWLSFVEYADELGLSASLQQFESPSNNRIKFLDALRGWLDIRVVGSGFAFAAVVMFVFTLQPESDGVERLYEKFASSTFPETTLATRSLGGIEKKDDVESIVIGQGYLEGLKRLNRLEGFEERLAHNYDIADVSSGLTASVRVTLKNLGAWAALSSLKCSGDHADYYEPALAVWYSLQEELSSLENGNDYLKKLNSDLNMSDLSGARVAVCQIASSLKKRIM